MILLTSTSDKLQVITGSGVPVDVHASFMDLNGTTVTPGRANTAITTATTTDVVGAPGASTQRNVHTVHCKNVHASSAVEVTVQHVSGAATVKLIAVTLAAGEKLAYVDAEGWRVFDVNGAEK